MTSDIFIPISFCHVFRVISVLHLSINDLSLYIHGYNLHFTIYFKQAHYSKEGIDPIIYILCDIHFSQINLYRYYLY